MASLRRSLEGIDRTGVTMELMEAQLRCQVPATAVVLSSVPRADVDEVDGPLASAIVRVRTTTGEGVEAERELLLTWAGGDEPPLPIEPGATWPVRISGADPGLATPDWDTMAATSKADRKRASDRAFRRSIMRDQWSSREPVLRWLVLWLPSTLIIAVIGSLFTQDKTVSDGLAVVAALVAWALMKPSRRLTRHLGERWRAYRAYVGRDH